jgi:hypothetical protein
MATPTPATVDDLLAYLDKGASAQEQNELTAVLEAATEAAEGWAPRGRLAVGPIVTRAFTERVRAREGRLYLPRAPIVSVTSATNIRTEQQYVTDELDVNTRRGVVQLLNGYLSPGDYTVVFTAGRGTVDDVEESLKLGVLIIAGHIWQTQQGPTTNRFIGSQDAEDSWRPAAGYLIPNRAAHLLTPHCPIGAA